MKRRLETRTVRLAPDCARFVCAVAGAFAATCSRPSEPPSLAPEVIHLRFVRPPAPELVFLNEDLVFYFSADVDRASVTRTSVQIRAGSEDARGTLHVDGEKAR